MNFLKRLLPLVGIALFVWFFSKLDFQHLLQIISQANIKLILLAELFLIPILLVKAFRWHTLNKMIPVKMSFMQSLRFYSIAMGVGIFTPGRAGEFLKIKYLRDHDESIGFVRPFTSTLLDRIFDLLFLVAIGALALVYFPLVDYELRFVYLVAALLILILAGVLVYRFRQKIFKIYRDIVAYLKKISFYKLLFLIFLTFLGFVFYYSQSVILSHSLLIDVRWGIIVGVVSISALITLLPISINGIGTRDATFVFLLSYFAIDPETAILFSALILFSSLIMSIMCLLFAYVFYRS